MATDAQGRTVVTLTFSGPETDPVSAQNGGNPSLADGRYQLTISSAAVTDGSGLALDGDGDGTPGGDFVSPSDTSPATPGQWNLYRLFGDTNGDGFVNGIDLIAFRPTIGTAAGDPNFVAALDANNDGFINGADLIPFRNRIGSSVFPTGPIVAPPPPTIAAVAVNDGAAQRSEVRSITVTFSGPVDFSGGSASAVAAFRLKHLSDDNDVALAATVATDSDGRTVVRLTFTGAETDPLSGENGGQAVLG